MSNVVEQIMHPMVEEIEAKYQVEIAELKTQLQDQKDSYEERISDAESSISEQISVIDSAFKDEDGKPIRATLENFITAIANCKLASYQRDWDVLGSVVAALKEIEEPIIETRYVTKKVVKYEKVEVLPQTISINGTNYRQN